MHAKSGISGVERRNAAALRRLHSRANEPLFVADWDRALFIHYEVDAAALRCEVPFNLDLHEGRAYVSLVAFTLRGLRPRFGGKLGEWLFKPIANHEFLNVRTCVKHQGEPGIFFLSEWLANSLSVRLGPRTFGLPYRLGEIEYQHQHEAGTLRGRVYDPRQQCALNYRATLPSKPPLMCCRDESLDDFLLERYTAFTAFEQRKRFFRIWHEPWLQGKADVEIAEDALLRSTFKWFAEARLVGAHYSPGLRNVQMGWSHGVGIEKVSQRKHRLSAFFELP